MNWSIYIAFFIGLCVVNIARILISKGLKEVKEKAYKEGHSAGVESVRPCDLRINLVPMSQVSVEGKNIFSATAQVTYWYGKLYEAKLTNIKREE